MKPRPYLNLALSYSPDGEFLREVAWSWRDSDCHLDGVTTGCGAVAKAIDDAVTHLELWLADQCGA